MNLGSSFADNPGSGSNPANRFAFKRMLPNQKLQTVEALFAYVSEWERAIAERDANRLAEKNGIADAGMRNQFRSAFVLAKALRKEDDVEVAVFLSDDKLSGGEQILRFMAWPAIVGAMKAWDAWMEREHLVTPTGTRTPTDSELSDLEAQARGE